MTSVLTFIGLLADALGLGSAVYETSPGTYLTQESSYAHALAAVEAATPEVPAEILLGVAWVESRYSPNAVSRVEDGKRKTGIPTWNKPPYGTRSFFCGATQVSAEDSWEKCKRFRSVTLAYTTLIEELNRWLSPRICNHNLTCALTGYNGGFPAIKSGKTSYAYTVMWRVGLIKKALYRKVP